MDTERDMVSQIILLLNEQLKGKAIIVNCDELKAEGTVIEVSSTKSGFHLKVESPKMTYITGNHIPTLRSFGEGQEIRYSVLKNNNLIANPRVGQIYFK